MVKELNFFDIVMVNSQITAPFCMTWATDNRVTVISDGGVHVLELFPTPVTDRAMLNFQQSWIPASPALPLKNVIKTNASNSYLWSLNRKDVNEMIINQPLACNIQKIGLLPSYITHCCISPLINHESYISCLTNNGALDIYKWEVRNWIKILDVAELWIQHCFLSFLFKKDTNITFDQFKAQTYQLKITTMLWFERQNVFFITGHEDGGICFWEASHTDERLTMQVKHYFHQIEKPYSMAVYHIQQSQFSILLIGFVSGIVRVLCINPANGVISSEDDLWGDKDLMRPSLLKTKYVDEELLVLTVKQHIIIFQRIQITSENTFQVTHTVWKEFSALVVGLNDFHDHFLVALQNHDLVLLKVSKDDIKMENIETDIQDKHKRCFYSCGVAGSPNQAIYVLASSSKVNYDNKCWRDMTQLFIFTSTIKVFKSLSDLTSRSLIEKIARTYEDSRLTDFTDLLELKKIELLSDLTNYKDNFEVTNEMSLLHMRLLLWEAKLKMHCQGDKLEGIVHKLERAIALRQARFMLSNYGNIESLSSLRARAEKTVELFYAEREGDHIEGNCVICGAETYTENVRNRRCVNKHTFPRCCLSLLPCEACPYAFCRICDAVALFEFVSESSYRCVYCDGSLTRDIRIQCS